MRDSKSNRIGLLAVSRHEYFTLIICTIISLSFLFANDNPRVYGLRAAIVDVWAGVLQQISGFRSGEELQQELARTRMRASELLLENSRLQQARVENEFLRSMLEFKRETGYTLLTASVIGRDEDQLVRSITIDVGTRDGVRKDLPVIVPEGIVGRVARAGQNSAVVQLLIDHNFHVACKIRESRVDGILAYEGGDYNLLTQVIKNAPVQVGETVVTSKISSIFPPELPVGRVVEIHSDPSTLFQTIKVQPFVEVERLELVFVMLDGNSAGAAQ